MALKYSCVGCGKKYKIPESQLGKVIRCKECGLKQSLPKNTETDFEELDFTNLDLTEEIQATPALKSTSPRKIRKPQKRKGGPHAQEQTTSSMIVFGLGCLLILPLIVSIGALLLGISLSPSGSNSNDPVADGMIAISLTLMVACLGTAILYYGENPNPKERWHFRKLGLRNIIIGILLMSVAIGILYVVASTSDETIAPKQAGTPLRYAIPGFGLFISGITYALVGFLGVTMGRDLKTRNMK